VTLQPLGSVELPPHTGAGGFDHAAVHGPARRLFVAHTANDAVDVVDLEARRYVGSVPGLTAVAGALVADGPDLVVTSNRGENTVGVFPVARPGGAVEKIPVGIRPNGLALDPGRGRVLVAHVGEPGVAGSCTVSVIDLARRSRIADLTVPGRTRWAVFDPAADVFHVNVADPPCILAVSAGDPVEIRRIVPVPWAGPHGLDIDAARRRLFCACDAGRLLEVDADHGTVLATAPLAGVPDVVFVNVTLGRVYVAVGDPGVLEVFDTAPLRHRQTVPTGAGAHTLAFDPARDVVCALLPHSHRAVLYADRR
jgi:DNA-binding beta-propeller fold protein YncE